VARLGRRVGRGAAAARHLDLRQGLRLAAGVRDRRRARPDDHARPPTRAREPRWLFIHGREDEAERIVDGIERDVTDETGQKLEAPDGTLTVRQREAIPFREIARVAFKLYPTRAVLGPALFTGQAFMYNALTFDLGTILGTFFGVASTTVPVFIVIYAIGNFLGPVTLGRLF
jgi:hypothetical protein